MLCSELVLHRCSGWLLRLTVLGLVAFPIGSGVFVCVAVKGIDFWNFHWKTIVWFVMSRQGTTVYILTGEVVGIQHSYLSMFDTSWIFGCTLSLELGTSSI